MKKLWIASDHAGFDMKATLKDHLTGLGHEVIDLGPDDDASVDYPDFAKRLGCAVAEANDGLGILLCGTGIGVSIAANKIKGIRAALCRTEHDAQMARNHNNANVICMAARGVQEDVLKRVLAQFLSAEFEGGRHQRRLDKISALE
ncbi:ribose 5-phosphate isomerase B [Acanthopleuribacter pedis]|uniref:Ribose 5-phosphate isomerase B n=1 Tax=Acanthopleuribacter pedis TaxID=442870 RepID=A0A8J7QEG8_9BACT|nr:ribose 5-phosphate isomerase B [Acanthopleuribacter pedis]MBO1316840.1 ribose 5-phosphate isomerase B [Acanthopleuribacter pedis]